MKSKERRRGVHQRRWRSRTFSFYFQRFGALRLISKASVMQSSSALRQRAKVLKKELRAGITVAGKDMRRCNDPTSFFLRTNRNSKHWRGLYEATGMAVVQKDAKGLAAENTAVCGSISVSKFNLAAAMHYCFASSRPSISHISVFARWVREAFRRRLVKPNPKKKRSVMIKCNSKTKQRIISSPSILL